MSALAIDDAPMNAWFIGRGKKPLRHHGALDKMRDTSIRTRPYLANHRGQSIHG